MSRGASADERRVTATRTVTAGGWEFTIRSLTAREVRDCAAIVHDRERLMRVIVLGTVSPQITYGRDPGPGEMSVFDTAAAVPALGAAILAFSLRAASVPVSKN